MRTLPTWYVCHVDQERALVVLKEGHDRILKDKAQEEWQVRIYQSYFLFANQIFLSALIALLSIARYSSFSSTRPRAQLRPVVPRYSATAAVS